MCVDLLLERPPIPQKSNLYRTRLNRTIIDASVRAQASLKNVVVARRRHEINVGVIVVGFVGDARLAESSAVHFDALVCLE